jgi:peptide deformylase
MARLTILEYPDPRLRTKARPVTAVTPELATLIDDMFETMNATRAIGLAATQVDVHVRIVTIDVSGEGSGPELFINPEIVSKRTTALVEESCMSLPGFVAKVERAIRVRVRAVDREGRPYERDLEDLLAVCLQHEIDHLDGKLFVDRLPFFARLRAKKQLAAASRPPAL